MSTLSERPENAVVGVRQPHESAVGHVTGRALYTDDIATARRDALTAWPVQAPHAHARITALRTEPALAVSGVVHVLTAADVPGVNDASLWGDEPLFPTEVMYHGHPVCWVLAETQEAARLGAAAVEVDYEPLPSLITVSEALAAGSFQGPHPTTRRGDVDAALATAPHVFEGVTEFSGQEHFYAETMAALSYYDEGGQMFIQAGTQHPTETQEIASRVLGVSSNAVTVQCVRMGGAFGGKELQPHGLAAIAAVGTTRTGRPVRLRLNRTQDFTITGKRHGFHVTWKAGFDDEGAHPGSEGDTDRRRRLEPRPVRARAGTGAVPPRQRLLDPGRRGARPDREDEQDLSDRVPRIRWTAGRLRDRGHSRALRCAARYRPGRAAATQLLRPGQTPRTASRSGTPNGSRPSGRSCWKARPSPPEVPRSRRSTPSARTSSVAWRSHRSSSGSRSTSRRSTRPARSCTSTKTAPS